jgi:uncharacterized membrane protein YkvA (DUF1232 family)
MYPEMAKSTIKRRWSLKNQILTLFYAFKDAETPWYAKLTSLLSIVYLLSPADLIPDVIPFAGYIDDLFIVPFLINISTKLLPAGVKKIAEQKALDRSKKLQWVFILAVSIIIGLLVLFFYVGNKLFYYLKESI